MKIIFLLVNKKNLQINNLNHYIYYHLILSNYYLYLFKIFIYILIQLIQYHLFNIFIKVEPDYY
jgi:hypothetical protein